jgi:hypothetical protein
MKKLFLPFVTVISVLFPMAATAQYWAEPLQSIQYNGVIIRSDIVPGSPICPILEIQQGLPCEGYEGYNDGTRTYTFWNNMNWNNNSGRNNRNWNNHQNPGWNNNQWRHTVPSQNWNNRNWNNHQNPGWNPRNRNWNNGGGCLFKQWTKNGGFQVGNC